MQAPKRNGDEITEGKKKRSETDKKNWSEREIKYPLEKREKKGAVDIIFLKG